METQIPIVVALEPGWFVIERTSSYGESPPCAGCVQVRLVETDWRCVDCPTKVGFFNGQTNWWYGEGTNHRVVDGWIGRDVGLVTAYIMRVDDIVEFVRKYGECVVYVQNDGRGLPTIEIYDSCRE